jgi:hypothetical protein
MNPIKPRVTEMDQIFRQKIRDKKREIKALAIQNLKVKDELKYFLKFRKITRNQKKKIQKC